MSITRSLVILTLASTLVSQSLAADKQPAKLNAEGEKALAEYSQMLNSLKEQLASKIPEIDPLKKKAFLATLENAADTAVKEPKMRGHKAEKLADESFEAAKPILADLDAFLGSADLDADLAKCAVLADATPRGLAEFAQQDPKNKQLVDWLLDHPVAMKEMLYAGGAKAGRYGKAMEIYTRILTSNPRAKEGALRRLALAAALELAAPDMCGYQDIDPLKRYKFYEKSYLDKELDAHFEKHSIWLYRHVVNEPQTEEDMAWMREMLWNYRPDHINAPEAYNARYVGLMYSEFGHKKPEYDENLAATRMQQFIDRGGQCGPKAFFGRCLGRSFGVPVWGCRLRSHTAMTYWTPKRWETILGVSFKNGFWIVDKADPMRAWVFERIATARNHPEEYIKVCRAQWIGSMLGEKKVDGMKPLETRGCWNALAFNKTRLLYEDNKPPEAPKLEKEQKIKGYPERLVKQPNIRPEFKKVLVGENGSITVPAVSCVSPTTNTKKIVFMNSRDNSMHLHYKRWENPEPVVYEVDVPKAGKYELAVDVVTVNRDQFFMLTANDAKKPVKVEMPYTVGKWGQSEPVAITLDKGKNKLSFARTTEEGVEHAKEAWKFAGPHYGGVTIKSFILTPSL